MSNTIAKPITVEEVQVLRDDTLVIRGIVYVAKGKRLNNETLVYGFKKALFRQGEDLATGTVIVHVKHDGTHASRIAHVGATSLSDGKPVYTDTPLHWVGFIQ